MCGIAGYIGEKEALPIVLNGLKRLEYRGYDSAGIVLQEFDNKDKLIVEKKAGKVKNLENSLLNKKFKSCVGIGHTRWATHGVVNDVNAHPHLTNSKNIAIIHNGIVENFLELKQELEDNGYHITSDTDTEVLANYIEYIQIRENLSLENALFNSLKYVKGQYAILILSLQNPDIIYAVRKGSPLAIGKGQKEYFMASDINPFLEHTDKVIYIPENTMASIKSTELIFKNLNSGAIIEPKIQNINTKVESLYKGDYQHYTLKEIHEQPNVLKKLALSLSNNEVFKVLKNTISSSQRFVILGCGSTLNVALWAKYIIERYSRIQVSIEQASEFRYRNPVIDNSDIFICISQSGETADLLNAVKLIKKHKAKIISICNVENSSLCRDSDYVILSNAGIEIGVASTKAFTAQMFILNLFAFYLSHDSTLFMDFINQISYIDTAVEQVFLLKNQVKDIASWLSGYKSLFFLGRDVYFPLAQEGALKLKELSYLHAEAYSSAEMKHGPIALIDQNFPVVYLASDEELLYKNISNIKEIKSRNGKIICVSSTFTSKYLDDLVDFNIIVPSSNRYILPYLNVITLQLLSYYVALEKQCDVDMPRNLAKSVTVE